MFFNANVKPECSVAQRSAMTHPFKWVIADVLSWKNIFSTEDTISYNELWRRHGILFHIITVRKWVEKIRKLMFSRFCTFFLYCVCFPADPSRLSVQNFNCLFLFMVVISWRSNKWSRIKYLVKTQISVHGNYIF